MLPLALLLFGCPDQVVAPTVDELTVAILSHRDGDVVQAAVPITFRALAQATVSRPDQISVAWFVGDTAACLDTPDEDGITECSVAIPAGEDTVRVEAQTPTGESSGAEVVLVVEATDQVPQVTIDAPVASDTLTAGTPFLFEGTVTDADDDGADLLVGWSSSIDGPLAISGDLDGNGRTSGVATLSVGSHLLSLTAEDPDGNVGSDSLLVTVAPDTSGNRLPTAPVVAIDPDPANDADTLIASLVTPSTDADGDTLTYVWAWFKNTVLEPTFTGTAVPAAATSPGDVWSVTATPWDGTGYGPAGTADVEVLEEADTDTDTDTDTDVDTDTDTDTDFDYTTCGTSAVYTRVTHTAGNVDFRRVSYAPDGSYALVLQAWDKLWRYDPADDSLTLVQQVTGDYLYAVEFAKDGDYALIVGSTASNTNPAPKMYRYVDGEGLTALTIPGIDQGGLPLGNARRVTAVEARPDNGLWAVLSDSATPSPSQNNIIYMNTLSLSGATAGWSFGGGINTGTTRDWAPDRVSWGMNLGGWIALTVDHQGSSYLWDPGQPADRWLKTSHPGLGNLDEAVFDPVGREQAWVINSGDEVSVYTWEGVLRSTECSTTTGPCERVRLGRSTSSSRMTTSPDGYWKLLVGGFGSVTLSSSAWRPMAPNRFVRVPIPNFDQPPWNASGATLQDGAWRADACSGLLVGSSASNHALLVKFQLF